jgi:hypothetical protein
MAIFAFCKNCTRIVVHNYDEWMGFQKEYVRTLSHNEIRGVK